jgi:hypothetical protein
MIRYWLGGTGAVVTLIGIAFAADGVLWETTSQMTMQGLPFQPRPQTTPFCAPAVWTRPPPGGDPSCKNTNYKRVGNKVTWDMACAGRMPMQGSGEITFEGADKYSGQITATAEGVTVIIALSGKKAKPPNTCTVAE